MKKILTILAATATMFAFGEDINQGADFEAFTAGDAFSAGLNDSAAQTNPYYWYTADADAANIISNYTNSGTDVPIASRPEKFADDQNSKYLQVETTGKLYRTVKDNGGSGDFTNSTGYAYSIEDAPIYLDTLVKFTAADSVFGDDALENGDKIAIEYVEHESEGEGDDTVTNFVIRAGYFAQTVIATNYFAAVPADFDKDAWHRLTVRTFASIDAANHVGFVVYLDGTPLEYEDTVLAGDDFTATGAAANFYKEGCHALYPSFVQGGDFQYSISAAAFSGNGSLDDVVFTTTMPEFIRTSSLVRTEITLGTGVADVKVGVESTSYEAAETNGTKFVFNLPAGTTSFVLAVTADTDNGYTFDAANGITASNDVTYVGTTITITGDSPALTLVGTRNNFNLFDVDGEPIEGTFQKLSDALAVEGVAKIQLAHDYDVLAVEGNEFAGYETGNDEYVLDLNGYTINGGDDSAGKALITVYGTLTIIDSRGGGEIIYDATQANTGILSLYGSDIYIGASTGDAGVTFTGTLFEDGSYGVIYKGYFDDVANGDSGAFIWANLVDTASTYSDTPDANNYWVVTPNGGSTTFALTTTGGANATITTDPAAVSALTEETEVTITATADQDYTYDGVDLDGTGWTYNSQTDAISMTTNISENTTVVVPDAVSEQSSEDWPTGQDLIDAEGYAAGDLFPGITNALATADAKAVATWATAQNVAYANKDSILPEAFLLNCANTQEAIDEAAANFKITAITVDGDTVTITPADGADYGNGKVVIEGTATLSPISWHEKTTGDHFFRATLVVNPVATP